MRAMWMVALAMAGACKGKAVTKPPPTAVQDALWALAPAEATFGIVISPDGLAQLERAFATAEQLIATEPDLAPIRGVVTEQLEELTGMKSLSLAANGLVTTGGVALFSFPEDHVLAILPVADRDTFAKARQGTKWTCKDVKSVYACATAPALFEQVGKGNLGVTLGLVGARGDIEIAGLLPMIDTVVAAAANIERGALTLHVAAKNLPERSRKLFANVKPRHLGDKTSAFGVVGIGQWEMLGLIPREPLVDGVTLDVLVKSVKGPLTLVGENGPAMVDLRIPLGDTGPAQKVIAQCDKLGFLVGAAVKDGACHTTGPELALDAWIEGDTLRVGKQGQTSTPPAIPLSALAQELTTGEWAVAIYGRGTLLGPSVFEGTLSALSGWSRIASHSFRLVDEVGVGFRLEGDTLRGVVGIRTIWTNPDDVVKKLLAIDPEIVFAREATAAAKVIADGAPRSPFAADYQAGATGLVATSGMLALWLYAGVPSFFESLKIPKAQATIQLEQLAAGAAAAYAAHGSFPKGKVGPTPARTCCGPPVNMCQPDPAAWSHSVWTALQFQITEPHVTRFAYESTDGKTYVVTSSADLDCNGVEGVWTMTGKIDSTGQPVTEARATNKWSLLMRAWVAIALAIASCKKEPPRIDRETLWALIPDDAVMGFVITPDGLARIEEGWFAVRELVARAPELAPWHAEVKAFEEELKKPLSLATVGLSAHEAAAVFFVDGGGEDLEPIVVVPMSNRRRLVEVLEGKHGEVDTFDGFTCKLVENTYGCARDGALVDRLGKGKAPDIFSTVGVRGEIEAFVAAPDAPKIGIVAQLTRGGFTLHAAAIRLPDKLKQVLATAKPRVEKATAGFAVIEPAAVLAAFGGVVPETPLGGGVTLASLVRSLAGPLTLTVDAGSSTLDLRIPLNENGPAQQLLGACDQIPAVAAFGASVKDGACHVANATLNAQLDGWLDGNTLRVGDRAGASAGTAPAMTPTAAKLANGAWTVAVTGRGTMFAPTTIRIPAEAFDDAIGLRILTLFNEISFGIRLDGSVLRAVLTVRTVWANPDDVVAKVTAIELGDIVTGKAAVVAKAIADAAPRSPFAADYQAGMFSLVVPFVVMAGLQELAATAIAPYMKW